jgi:hypothetical protein
MQIWRPKSDNFAISRNRVDGAYTESTPIAAAMKMRKDPLRRPFFGTPAVKR